MTNEKRQATPSLEDRNTGKWKQLFSTFRVQIERYSDDKKILLISAAKAILYYSTSFLELDIGGEYLVIRGKSLLCRTFVNGNIEVLGRIEDITISKVYCFPEGEA